MTIKHGSPSDDTLSGANPDDQLYGEGGNDRLSGNGGGDRIDGGDGDDWCDGGEGRDSVYGSRGADSLFGGAGDDQVNGSTVLGGIGPDTGLDRLDGGAGNDVVSGRAGDTLIGGDGFDVLFFYTNGSDIGVDIRFDRIAEHSLKLADGSRLMGFEYGEFTLGDADDRVRSGSHGLFVEAGGGADSLIGSGERDVLWGEAGDDYLSGLAGDDELATGSGRNRVRAGDGSDAIQLAFDNRAESGFSRTTVVDLDKDDYVDFFGLDGDISTVDEDEPFHWVGSFTGAAGEATLRYAKADAQTIVELDWNGDSAADLRLVMLGDHRDFAGFRI